MNFGKMLEFLGESLEVVPTVGEDQTNVSLLSGQEQKTIEKYKICRLKCGGTGRFDLCDDIGVEPKSGECKRALGN